MPEEAATKSANVQSVRQGAEQWVCKEPCPAECFRAVVGPWSRQASWEGALTSLELGESSFPTFPSWQFVGSVGK